MKDWQKYSLIYLLAYYLSPQVRTLTRTNFKPLADLLDRLLFPPTAAAPTTQSIYDATLPGFEPGTVVDGTIGGLSPVGINDVLGE